MLRRHIALARELHLTLPEHGSRSIIVTLKDGFFIWHYNKIHGRAFAGCSAISPRHCEDTIRRIFEDRYGVVIHRSLQNSYNTWCVEATLTPGARSLIREALYRSKLV